MSGQLEIAGRKFSSRLLLGTGKFSSNEVMRDALAASGTEIVTVALRRADISGRRDPYANILDFIQRSIYFCRTPVVRLMPPRLCALPASRPQPAFPSG
jgi:thiazole synthase